MKRDKTVFDTTFSVSPDAPEPLYRQLYNAVREAILEGRLQPGQRLPATRVLAETLSVSRSTVVLAFEQLFAEGYLEGITGSGTYVGTTLPDDLLQTRQRRHPTLHQSDQRPGLSKRGKRLASSSLNPPLDPFDVRPFRAGIPALDAFPTPLWARTVARQARSNASAYMNYAEPGGYRPLQEVIATYLRSARAARCEPEQIIITNGAQQGLNLVARVLLDPGDVAWVGDPGYLGTRGALQGAGITPHPVPIDEEGLCITYGAETAPDARLVYVTPSHQYPLGVIMSLRRRLALLEWAAQSQAWILEDDYDSEYRYEGRPLASLQGLDTHQRVIYLGTFSKVLFPGLRIGYLVVPPDLTEAFRAARAILDRHCNTFDQMVVTAFIKEGHLGRHIRRMRVLYQQRQQILIEAITDALGDRLRVEARPSGMHLVGWLPADTDDLALARRLAEAGLTAPPLSTYTIQHTTPPGLVLGYAAFDEAQIRKAVQTLSNVMDRA